LVNGIYSILDYIIYHNLFKFLSVQKLSMDAVMKAVHVLPLRKSKKTLNTGGIQKRGSPARGFEAAHETPAPLANKADALKMFESLPRVAEFLEKLGFLQRNGSGGYSEKSLLKSYEMLMQAEELLPKIRKRMLAEILVISSNYFGRWNAFSLLLKFCAEDNRIAKMNGIGNLKRISSSLIHVFSSEADKYLCALLENKRIVGKMKKYGIAKVADKLQEQCGIIVNNKENKYYIAPAPKEFSNNLLYVMS